MIIYLLGCLVVILLLTLSTWLEYEFENCVSITIKDVLIFIIFILLSWLGFILILVSLLYILLEKYGDRIIFNKTKE